MDVAGGRWVSGGQVKAHGPVTMTFPNLGKVASRLRDDG